MSMCTTLLSQGQLCAFMIQWVTLSFAETKV